MAKQELLLSVLTLDPEVQSRVEINDKTVEEYAERIRDGEHFPAPVVFLDGVTHYLTDGFHRRLAYQQAGINQVECEVHHGTKRDAKIFSAGCNGTHGLPRTVADKRRAVEMLLTDSEWAMKSDRQIADHARVSHTMVSQYRHKRNTPPEPQQKPEPPNGDREPPERDTRDSVKPENTGTDEYPSTAEAATDANPADFEETKPKRPPSAREIGTEVRTLVFGKLTGRDEVAHVAVALELEQIAEELRESA